MPLWRLLTSPPLPDCTCCWHRIVPASPPTQLQRLCRVRRSPRSRGSCSCRGWRTLSLCRAAWTSSNSRLTCGRWSKPWIRGRRWWSAPPQACSGGRCCGCRSLRSWSRAGRSRRDRTRDRRWSRSDRCPRTALYILFRRQTGNLRIDSNIFPNVAPEVTRHHQEDVGYVWHQRPIKGRLFQLLLPLTCSENKKKICPQPTKIICPSFRLSGLPRLAAAWCLECRGYLADDGSRLLLQLPGERGGILGPRRPRGRSRQVPKGLGQVHVGHLDVGWTDRSFAARNGGTSEDTRTEELDGARISVTDRPRRRVTGLRGGANRTKTIMLQYGKSWTKEKPGVLIWMEKYKPLATDKVDFTRYVFNIEHC